MKFKFSNKQEQIEALVEFIDANAEAVYEYETKHNDAATAYLFDSGYLKEVASYKDMYTQADDEIKKAMLKAEKAGVKARDVIEIAIETAETQTGNAYWPANMIGGIPVGELEVHLDGLNGNVNGKVVTDVLEVLSKGLTAEDLKKVAGKVNLSWQPGSRYGHYNTDDYWWAVISADAFIKDLKDLTSDAEGTKKAEKAKKDARASNDPWFHDKNSGSWTYDPDNLLENGDDIKLPTVVLEDKGYAYYEQGSDYPNGVIDKEAVGPDVSEEDFDEVALETAKEAALEGGYETPEVEEDEASVTAAADPLHDEVGKFWVVTYPSDLSVVQDVCFNVDAFGFVRQFKGGLKEEQVAGLFKKEADAKRLALKLVQNRQKMIKSSTADSHQLKILLDTVKNPNKALLGGPSVKEAIEVLKKKFKYSDSQIKKLQEGK